jgi:putative CocE/NonD family hydrolase
MVRLSAAGRPETRLERNLLVPLADGATLAADLRLPAAPGRYPALVSYYPYRKDDVIASGYEHANTYFAQHGYATLLVDFRGLGGSSGVAADAMDASEAADLAELLAWTAAQPWCDGNVGMWGLSYGGITALRAAAARTPHLKAIAPIMASADIYGDWFYPGGCRNCLGALGVWGSFMLAMQLAPPMLNDPEGRWRRVWRERLESGRPYLLPWFDHPARDGYWASKAIPLERIAVPTFLVGGWRDLFPEAMARAFERIDAPKRLLMGPWLHTPPDASPFVQVDHLAEMLAFFDAVVAGSGDGPRASGATFYVQGAGIWRQEAAWPPPGEGRTVYLGADGSLAERPASSEEGVAYTGDPTVGACAGLWDPLGTGLGLPLDQGPDDLRSLTFTGPPLAEGLEIAGSPEAVLHVALEAGDDLQLAVKLCEVLGDGSSRLVTSGWLEGTHRRSHERPEPVPHGEVCEYRVPLWATAYRLAPGSRLRVSVACADFPRVWPSRTNPVIRLVTGGARASSVALPTVGPPAQPALPPPAPDPSVDRAPATIDYAPRWEIERDLAADAVSVRCGTRMTLATPGRDGTLRLEHLASARVARERPDAAGVRGETSMELHTPSGAVAQVETGSLITADGAVLSGRVVVDGQTVFERRWER